MRLQPFLEFRQNLGDGKKWICAHATWRRRTPRSVPHSSPRGDRRGGRRARDDPARGGIVTSSREDQLQTRLLMFASRDQVRVPVPLGKSLGPAGPRYVNTIVLQSGKLKSAVPQFVFVVVPLPANLPAVG